MNDPPHKVVVAEFTGQIGDNTVGRHAGVSDIVPVIDFLGSPAAGWICGQDIVVDGGLITSITTGTPITV